VSIDNLSLVLKMGIFGSSRPDVAKFAEEGDAISLIGILDHKNQEIRRDAKRALIDIGQAAVEALIANIQYADGDIRKEAAEILGEIAGLGVVVIRGGLIQLVNSAATGFSGYRREELVGRQFVEFVTGEYEELLLEMYKKRLMAEKVPNKYNVEIRSKAGVRIPVEITASLIDFEGRPADLTILRPLI